MASMFETIRKQGGSGGPEWLSSHPDPGNRSEAITREAALLRIQNPVSDTRAFAAAQARLRELAPAPTTADATQASTGRSPAPRGAGTLDPGRVAAPASSTTTYSEGDVFRVSVPSNWREMPGSDSVTFAPDGAFGAAEGQDVVTHGMVIGVARNEARDINAATEEFVSSLAAGNPSLRRNANYTRTTLSGRQWLRTTLVNRSPGTTQDERIAVFTALLEDGTLFYALGIAPQDRFASYESTFRKIVGSIRFAR